MAQMSSGLSRRGFLKSSVASVGLAGLILSGDSYAGVKNCRRYSKSFDEAD